MCLSYYLLSIYSLFSSVGWADRLYFLLGGIKLGAGGLIRAYGGAARLVLREAPKETLIPKTSIRTLVPSQNAGSVYDAVAKIGGVASDEEYTAEGDFIVTLTCDLEKEGQLRTSLTDATRGSVQFLVEQDDVDTEDR